MIDVLVPVLRRPQNVEPLFTSLMAASRHVGSIVFLCSETDTEEIMEIQRLGIEPVRCQWPPGRADYARKMNHGFSLTDHEFVFLGADDLTFEPGWDEMVLRMAKHLKPGVVATNDMNNPSVQKGLFGTHCLVRRSYVMEYGGCLEGPGHLLSEVYDHNFVDRELCHLADSRGLYAFAEQSHVVHRWGGPNGDDTYRKGYKQFRQDQRLFLRRIRGLPT